MTSKWVSLWNRAAICSRLGKPKPFLTTYSNENFLFLKNMSDETREDHPIKPSQLQPPMDSTNKWPDQEIALAKERETVTCLRSTISTLEKNLADVQRNAKDESIRANALKSVYRTQGEKLLAATVERRRLEQVTINLKKNVIALEYSQNIYVQQLQTLESEFEDIRSSLERIQHENDHKLEEIEMLQFLYNKLQNDNAELSRCLKELEALLQTASSESEEKSKSLVHLQRSLDTTSAENDELKRLLGVSDKCMECLMVEDVKTIFGIRTSESDGDVEEIEAGRKLLHGAQQHNEDLRESFEVERVGLLNQIQSLKIEMGRVEKQKQKLEEENGVLVARVRDTSNMVNGLADNVRRLQREKENLEKQTAEYDMVCKECCRLEGELMEAVGEMSAQKSRAESLLEELSAVQASLKTHQSENKALQESLRIAESKLQFHTKVVQI